MITSCEVCGKTAATGALFVYRYRLGDAPGEEPVGICNACAGSYGPGKFEGSPDYKLARLLYECMLNGWADEMTIDDCETQYDLIGRYIVWEDDRGFFHYDEFPSKSKAHEVLRNIG